MEPNFDELEKMGFDCSKMKDHPGCVDMYSKKGTKVKLIMKDGKVWGGSDWQGEETLKFLDPEKEYTVKNTDVQSFSSSFEFEEIPNKRFNTVMFTNA